MTTPEPSAAASGDWIERELHDLNFPCAYCRAPFKDHSLDSLKICFQRLAAELSAKDAEIERLKRRTDSLEEDVECITQERDNRQQELNAIYANALQKMKVCECCRRCTDHCLCDDSCDAPFDVDALNEECPECALRGTEQ